METYSGTASRSDQRLVDAVTSMHTDWVSFSFDVSKAFAKGMTFEEIAEETGAPQRKVEFQLTGEDLEILRTIPEFADYDPQAEVLAMDKPIYGLKDAPRAWRRKLDRVLRAWKPGAGYGPLVPLKAAPELYVAHKIHKNGDISKGPNVIERAIMSDTLQSEMPDNERAQTDN